MKPSWPQVSITTRASEPPDPRLRNRCSAFGCKKLTQRGQGKGLSPTYCRQHIDHIARHGSSWRKSLTGAELEPYRKAAARWLEANSESPFVLAAEAALSRMMAEAGPVIIAPHLHREESQTRATQVLARMRDKGVLPRMALTEALAATVALRSLEGIPRDSEYRSVQIAKRVHRLGSRFEIRHGAKVAWQWHPEPRGRMLRHLGRMMWECLDTGFGEADLKAVAAMIPKPDSKV